MSSLYDFQRAGAPVDRGLRPDERRIAAALLMVADARMSPEERMLCIAATQPGAPPLDLVDKLRLAVIAGVYLKRCTP
jgi:hypothetical protein